MIKNQETVGEDKKKACEIPKKNKFQITRIHALLDFLEIYFNDQNNEIDWVKRYYFW